MRVFYTRFHDYWPVRLQKQMLEGLVFIFILLLVQTGYAQPKALSISGTVKDALTMQPISGTYVRVKGSTAGTVTDFNGNFNIKVSSPQTILDFSFMGYIPQSVPLNGRIKLDFCFRRRKNDLMRW